MAHGAGKYDLEAERLMYAVNGEVLLIVFSGYKGPGVSAKLVRTKQTLTIAYQMLREIANDLEMEANGLQ